MGDADWIETGLREHDEAQARKMAETAERDTRLSEAHAAMTSMLQEFIQACHNREIRPLTSVSQRRRVQPTKRRRRTSPVEYEEIHLGYGWQISRYTPPSDAEGVGFGKDRIVTTEAGLLSCEGNRDWQDVTGTESVVAIKPLLISYLASRRR